MTAKQIQDAIDRREAQLQEHQDLLDKNPNDPIARRNFQDYKRIYDRDMRILEGKQKSAA